MKFEVNIFGVRVVAGDTLREVELAEKMDSVFSRAKEFDGIPIYTDRKEILEVLGVASENDPVLLAVLGIIKENYSLNCIACQSPDESDGFVRFHVGMAAGMSALNLAIRRAFAEGHKVQKRSEKRKKEKTPEIAG